MKTDRELLEQMYIVLEQVDALLDGMAVEGIKHWLLPPMRPLYSAAHLAVQAVLETANTQRKEQP